METTYTIGIKEDEEVNRETIKMLARARKMSRGEFVTAVIRERYSAQINAFLEFSTSVSQIEQENPHERTI